MSTTPTCGELSCDECNARTATLETELAAALLRIKELEDDNDNLLMDLLEASK